MIQLARAMVRGSRVTRDRRSLKSVRAAVASALASTETEIRRLVADVEEARVRGGLALGTEDAIWFEREAEQEKLLGAVEQELDQSLQQLSRMREQHVVLKDISALVHRLPSTVPADG